MLSLAVVLRKAEALSNNFAAKVLNVTPQQDEWETSGVYTKAWPPLSPTVSFALVVHRKKQSRYCISVTLNHAHVLESTRSSIDMYFKFFP